jgi:hypothetical protein
MSKMAITLSGGEIVKHPLEVWLGAILTGLSAEGLAKVVKQADFLASRASDGRIIHPDLTIPPINGRGSK